MTQPRGVLRCLGDLPRVNTFRRSESRFLPTELFCNDAGWRPAEMFNLALESVPIYPVPVGFKGTCKRIYRLQVL